MAKKASKKTVKKTTKKPASKKVERPYPRAAISEAIRIPLALKEYNGGNSWPPNDLKGVVDSSIGNRFLTNNQFYYLTAASRDFGLTTGSRDAQEIGLTDLGKEFVYAGSAAEEKAALRKAFYSIDIFKRVSDHYKKGDLPEKKYVANTLEATFGLHPDVHDEFLELYRDNVRYLGQESGSIELVDSGAEAIRIVSNLKDNSTSSDSLIVVAEPDDGSDQICFVAMPFRRRTNTYPEGFFGEVLTNLIGPAGAAAGFKVVTANQTGSDVIQSTIINSLYDSHLVLADLTEHNPNVLYELGVRMAIDKPVCLIRAQDTPNIFDVDNMLRVYDYSPKLWKTTVESDLPNLTAHIRASWDRRNSERTYMKILRGAVS